MTGISGNNSINSGARVNQNKLFVGLKKFDVQNNAELKSVFDKYNTDGDDTISQSEYEQYEREMLAAQTDVIDNAQEPESTQATEITDAPSPQPESSQSATSPAPTESSENASQSPSAESSNNPESANTKVYYNEDGTVDHTEEKQGNVTTTKDASGRITKKRNRKRSRVKRYRRI